MADPYPTPSHAARALFNCGRDLSARDGRFLGQITFAVKPLTIKQRDRLVALLLANGLPKLGGAK